MSSLSAVPRPHEAAVPPESFCSAAQGRVAAYGLYPKKVPLENVVSRLNQEGVRNQDICLLLSPDHPIAAQIREMRLVALETISRPVLAGLVGWLSRLGAVVISNVGLFIRSRAYLHAFLSPETSVCQYWGTLANLGISEPEAKRLGTRIDQEGGLIYVNCSPSGNSQGVLDILRRTGSLEASCLASLSCDA